MFKLHHPCLDVLTEDQQAHAELKWKYIHPIICCMAVSLLIQQYIEDCGVVALPIPQLIGLVVL